MKNHYGQQSSTLACTAKRFSKTQHEHAVRNSGTILVADDQAANRELLDELLPAEGVRKAVLATSGPVTADDDMDGQTRTIEITYTRSDVGTAPDPALFNFTPPADAYLIDDARQPMSKPVIVGSASPPLKLKDKSGVTFDLADLKGKVALVHFWASWCGACLEEMKALTQLPKSYADKGLVIVAVDEDEVPERGDSYFSSRKYEWRNFHDAGETNRRIWGAAGYPFLAILDRDGKVTWTNVGAGKGFLDTLTSQLKKPELALAP